MKKDNQPEKLICESCGRDFRCGAREGKCWCFEIDLPPEVPARLRENYASCLCADCLAEEIKSAVSGKVSNC